MKRIIKNPFSHLEGYNCFGCSPKNPLGLQLTFYEEGDFATAEWNPGSDYQGYLHILHGGIQATLMDEVASWTIFAKLKTTGVTSKLQIRYKKSVRTDEGAILVKGQIKEVKRNLVEVSVSLYDAHGTLCADGTVLYYLFSKEKAQNELGFVYDENADLKN